MELPEEIQRRRFLALCATGTLPGLLTACQFALPQAGDSALTAQLARTTLPTSDDWSKLARNIRGQLILPSNPRYATAHQLFDPRFDTIHPAAIAYCTLPADVQSCVNFASRFHLPLAPRSGGHSYAGYSTTTGLVLDVSAMNTIAVDVAARTATIGAGAQLIDIYATLARHNLVLPAGSCPTVGIAGLTLGGGMGFLSRKFGLTCDNLLAAQVVVADERILTCDATHYPDLFWALRGGGGGNFGVATSFTFQVHPVTNVALFTIGWPWNLAAAVIEAWQSWAPQAPDELVANCQLEVTGDNQSDPHIRLIGVYVGDVAPLNALLEQLSSHIGSPPTVRTVWGASLIDAMLHEAYCKSIGECHLLDQKHPDGKMERMAYSAKSDYFSTPLPPQGIDILLKAISQSQASSSTDGGVALDVYGGAVNRIPADATAFVHRNALFCIQYTANWNAGDPDSVIAANRSWLHDVWKQMQPYANGTAYQNYIDPDLPNWQHAYYGANLAQLQHVKATYDPANLFRFTQSIPPAS